MTVNLSQQTIDDIVLVMEKYKMMQKVSLEKAQSEIERTEQISRQFIKELNIE